MAVNKVVLGEDTLIDLTADTVSADKLAKGTTAHDMAGEPIVGTMEAGGGKEYTFTDGLTETDGTVKWDLSDRIKKGDNSKYSIKMGYLIGTYDQVIESTGYGSVAFGLGGGGTQAYNKIVASGNGSLAFGTKGGAAIAGQITASGNGSLAHGESDIISYDSLDNSRAIIASGEGSHAEGYASTHYGGVIKATTNGAHAEGGGTTASGYLSHAEGQSTIANHLAQHSAGRYNIPDDSTAKYYQYGNYTFIIGNGTSDADRSNAYTLDWQGNGTFAGTVSSATGADYAEYFEWKDGNPNNEDRVGYIVTLDGGKIVKANTGDDVLGICSGTAMVLGDSAEWNWSKRYLTDDFGRIIYEDYDVEHEEIKDEETGKVIEEAWTEHIHAPKQNPEYDASKPYIKRADRPEWQIVGMMGKLYVRDDGSCVVNGYADVKDGIATKANSKTNMRVMERVTDNIVRVLMK